jgi:hypothetical protein
MQPHDHDDLRLDPMLDAAIATYADPAEALQTRPFAARVMASVQDAGPRRRGWLWGLVIGVPVLAALMMTAFLLTRAPQQPRIAIARKAVPAVAPPSPHMIPTKVAAAHLQHRQKPERHEVAKLEQFPAQQPLSEQERLLVAFAEHAPESAKKAVIDSRKQIAEPLHISTIEIQSLDTTPLTQNGRFLPAAYPASSPAAGTQREQTNKDIQP